MIKTIIAAIKAKLSSLFSTPIEVEFNGIVESKMKLSVNGKVQLMPFYDADGNEIKCLLEDLVNNEKNFTASIDKWATTIVSSLDKQMGSIDYAKAALKHYQSSLVRQMRRALERAGVAPEDIESIEVSIDTYSHKIHYRVNGCGNVGPKLASFGSYAEANEWFEKSNRFYYSMKNAAVIYAISIAKGKEAKAKETAANEATAKDEPEVAQAPEAAPEAIESGCTESEAKIAEVRAEITVLEAQIEAEAKPEPMGMIEHAKAWIAQREAEDKAKAEYSEANPVDAADMKKAKRKAGARAMNILATYGVDLDIDYVYIEIEGGDVFLRAGVDDDDFELGQIGKFEYDCEVYEFLTNTKECNKVIRNLMKHCNKMGGAECNLKDYEMGTVPFGIDLDEANFDEPDFKLTKREQRLFDECYGTEFEWELYEAVSALNDSLAKRFSKSGKQAKINGYVWECGCVDGEYHWHEVSE